MKIAKNVDQNPLAITIPAIHATKNIKPTNDCIGIPYIVQRSVETDEEEKRRKC